MSDATRRIGRLPRVAIVTPVYNGATYLLETMESVQALDYPNLVHVVLDNASTDDTPAIVAQFHNGRVPVVATTNATTIPMAANWNAATRLIPNGTDYFWTLCADDTLAPHAISRVVEVAERDPSVVLVGCQWRIDDDNVCGKDLPKDRNIFDGKGALRSYLRREHTGLAGMHVLVRRSLLEANQDYYDRSLVMFDTDANLRACLRGNFGFVHEELANWRRHNDSTTNTVTLKKGLRLSDWLLLIDRYGPLVLGHSEYLDCRSCFRRHYLRRLLLARFRDGDTATFDWHMNVLRARDDAAGWTDFVEALVEWVFLALTLQRHSVGQPRRPAPHRVDVAAQMPLF